LPEPEELLKFRVPEVKDKEIYVVRLEDGRVVARMGEELEELKKEKEGEKKD